MPADTLRKKLETIIDALPKDTVSVGVIRDALGKDGMLLFVILLTVIFLIPVSIPGVSTVFGATILLIGISILCGWNLWLPKKILIKQFPASTLHDGFDLGLRWVSRLEKISKPHRLVIMTNNRFVHTLNGLSLILGAVLLMFPFGFIPLSNTLPALALLLYAIGLLQKDGLSILCGHFFTIVTIAYFGLLIVGGGAVVQQLINILP